LAVGGGEAAVEVHLLYMFQQKLAPCRSMVFPEDCQEHRLQTSAVVVMAGMVPIISNPLKMVLQVVLSVALRVVSSYTMVLELRAKQAPAVALVAEVVVLLTVITPRLSPPQIVVSMMGMVRQELVVVLGVAVVRVARVVCQADHHSACLRWVAKVSFLEIALFRPVLVGQVEQVRLVEMEALEGLVDVAQAQC
jgi:hypothetical protein